MKGLDDERFNALTLDQQDESLRVTRETRRRGHEPPPESNDRPEQNIAYDKVVKGRPLTDEERRRTERESQLKK